MLGRFRPHDDLAAAPKGITDEDGDPAPIPAGRVPLSWLSNRRVAHARIMGDLDLSAAAGPHRELTQAIARELHLHADTHAIEYLSRYGETIRSIAVFETDGDLPDIKPVGAAYGPSVEADDHALERAMRLHRLSWEL